MCIVVQAAQFPKMPRWLAEGMAKSVDESPDSTLWWPGRATAFELGDALKKGPVSQNILWLTSGVSGPSEGPKYALSHLVADYLRFGGFSVPETRLFCLMGELNRGAGRRRMR